MGVRWVRRLSRAEPTPDVRDHRCVYATAQAKRSQSEIDVSGESGAIRSAKNAQDEVRSGLGGCSSLRGSAVASDLRRLGMCRGGRAYGIKLITGSHWFLGTGESLWSLKYESIQRATR